MFDVFTTALAKHKGMVLTVEVGRSILKELRADRRPDISGYAACRGRYEYRAEYPFDGRSDTAEFVRQRQAFLDEIGLNAKAENAVERLREIERAGSSVVLTVRFDGRLVGGMWLFFHSDINTGERVAMDDMLYIDPAHRGGFHAVRLWMLAESVAQEAFGAVRAESHALTRNDAARLSRFMGYEQEYIGLGKRLDAPDARRDRRWEASPGHLTTQG